jgi:hypothetical protein
MGGAGQNLLDVFMCGNLLETLMWPASARRDDGDMDLVVWMVVFATLGILLIIVRHRQLLLRENLVPSWE